LVHRYQGTTMQQSVRLLRASVILVSLIFAVFTGSSRIFGAAAVQETFEGAVASWQVTRDTGGSGTVTASNARAAAGTFSARAATSGSGSVAQVRVAYTDAGGSHTWQERPGTYRWQRLRVYLPSTSVAQLGATEYLTIAGFWASGSGGPGWFLRVRQNGALYVTGNRDSDNARVEFQVYGTFPQDRWVDLELGLHSQAGPGIKRAFAFLVDGSFYGWYHQGRMQAETYDRVAAGILDTNSADPLEVFMDEWRVPTTTALPDGTDTRSTAALQEQDFRAQSGVSWQIDWTTWANDLRLDPTFGIFSNVDRLQSGRNLDRMPSLTSGWAEIEIDWSKGTPPLQPNGYFSAMVGFRKELNREQNIEVIPYGRGNGNVDLVLEYWTGSATMVAQWPIPLAAAASSHIPERGDIIRVRWEQVGATDLDLVQRRHHRRPQRLEHQWRRLQRRLPHDVVDHHRLAVLLDSPVSRRHAGDLSHRHGQLAAAGIGRHGDHRAQHGGDGAGADQR
jgi:hypothetical protein